MPNVTDQTDHHDLQPLHQHTTGCWWDHQQARWVCATTAKVQA